MAHAVLIGFQDQGNLGIGYLAAALGRQGFEVLVLDFRDPPEVLLRRVRSAKPVLVGFSLIFQFYLERFVELAAYLRNAGVKSHFCAGGHFPTLRSAEVLERVPELDSIVCGEGEETLVELLSCLTANLQWHDIGGIAYRVPGGCEKTPPRSLIADLDSLAEPQRCWKPLKLLGQKTTPILASRGCWRDCSFCSIREFYGRQPGRKVRVRTPGSVAREMKRLYEEEGFSIFLFQDDDFPLGAGLGRKWVPEFLDQLSSSGLIGKVIWKISCRADELEPNQLIHLRAGGLYLVYLGLESGNREGLLALNKETTVEQNLRAVKVLKEAGMPFTYGFMMFDPSTSFASLHQNTDFLRQISCDGSVPVTFCRMLPYACTAIEAKLQSQGRLRGDRANPDYTFRDPRLDTLFTEFSPFLHTWIGGRQSPLCQLNWAWQELYVAQRLFRCLDGLWQYERELQGLTREHNALFLKVFQDCTTAFETDSAHLMPSLDDFVERCRQLGQSVVAQRDTFVRKNQASILSQIAPSRETRPLRPAVAINQWHELATSSDRDRVIPTSTRYGALR